MNLVFIIFLIFATLLILATLGVLLSRNVLYAAFYLLFTFLSVAAIYVLAGADFLAMSQILIYVGGILVLILFGIMFTSRRRFPGVSELSSAPQTQSLKPWTGYAGGILFLALMTWMIFYTSLPFPKSPGPVNQAAGTAPAIGTYFLTYHIIAFELSAIVLLIALIGASSIAGKTHYTDHESPGA